MSLSEQLKVRAYSGGCLVGPLTLLIGGGSRGVHACRVQPPYDKHVAFFLVSIRMESFFE